MDRIILYAKNKLSQFQWPRRNKLTPYPRHHRFMYSAAYEDRIEKKRDEILLLALQTEKEMISLRHKAVTEGVDEQTLRELEDMVSSIGEHLSERLIHVGASTQFADKDKTFSEDMKDLREDFRDSLTKPFKETAKRVKEDVNPIRDTVRERAKEVREGVTEDLKKLVNITTSTDPNTSKMEKVKDFIEYNVVKGKTYEDKLKGKQNELGGRVSEFQERMKEEPKGHAETKEVRGKQQTSERAPLDYGGDVQTMKDDIDTRAIDVKEKSYGEHDKKKGSVKYGDVQDQRSSDHEPHVTKMGGNKDLLSKDNYELHGEETFDWAVEKAKSMNDSIEEGRYKPHDTKENIQATVRDVAQGMKERAKGFAGGFKNVTHDMTSVEGIKERAQDVKDYVQDKVQETKEYVEENVGEEKTRKVKDRGVDVKENIQELGKTAAQKVKSAMPSMENVREVSKDELREVPSDIKEKVKGTAESVKSKGEKVAGNIVNKVEHVIFGEKTDEINEKVSHGAHVAKEKLEEGTKYMAEKIKEGFHSAKERYEEDQRKKELEKEKGPYSKDFREEEFINEPSADMVEGTANFIKDTAMGGAYAAKDKLEEGYEYVKDKAQQVDTEDIKKGAQKVQDKVKQGYEYVKDKAKQTDTQDIQNEASNVKGKVQEGYEDVKANVKEGYEKIKENLKEGYEDVKGNVENKGVVEGVKEEAKKAKNKVEESYDEIKGRHKDKKEEKRK